MSEVQHPIQSTAGLIKALIVALIIAAILFVTMVLPAEFGIDPTGIGSRLGLNNLISAEPESQIVARSGEGDLPFREDETVIIVPANKGLEYKFHLPQYAGLTYEWSAGRALYFDLHGEPDGDTTGYFESFASATGNKMTGSVIAPFAGSHGWYWRNSTDVDASITLKTQGNYEVIGLK